MKSSLRSLAGLLLATACGPEAALAPVDVTDSAWANLGRPCPANAAAFSLPPARRDSVSFSRHDIDDDWAEIARDVPGGWGGALISEEQFTIWLVNPAKRDAAIAALRTRLTLPPGYSWENTQVWHGRWDYVQLRDWYRYLQERLDWSAHSLSSTDLNEGRNRLRFGVTTAEGRTSLEAKLATMDLPCYLIAIEIEPPVVLH